MRSKHTFLFCLLACAATRALGQDGIITTIAGSDVLGPGGDGGPATACEMYYPAGVAADPSGNVFISDMSNHMVRKISASTGIITMFMGGGTEPKMPAGIACDAAGNVYVADKFNNQVKKIEPTSFFSLAAGSGTTVFGGDGGPATNARLYRPADVAVDATGNLYIADTYHDRIRKVNTSGTITTIAGNGTQGFSGDGGDATAAALHYPTGVAADAAGNVYIADTYNHRIRKVSPDGKITTIAGSSAAGYGGDSGPATAARLLNPGDVVTGNDGSLYIADVNNNRIRKVSPAGIITTIAGNGIAGFSGDGGNAISAQLRFPAGIGLDASGNLYIADQANNRIRKVTNVTAVSDADPEAKIAIFPNPASDQITIHLPASQYTSLAISNSVGVVVVNQVISQSDMQVDLAAMPPGIYFVALHSQDGVVRKKFTRL
jgi:sugar lactone lactonase YvrE